MKENSSMNCVACSSKYSVYRHRSFIWTCQWILHMV